MYNFLRFRYSYSIMTHPKHVFSVLAAGTLWGIISLFIRRLSAHGFTALQIMTVRASFSVPLAAAVLLVKDRCLFRIHLRDVWMFAGTGILSLAFFSICYFTTIVNCGASVAVVLLYTSPVFIILLSALFFHERITPVKAAAVLMTCAGSILVAGIAGTGVSISLPNFIIGLGAGLGYALYSIFGRIALKKYDTVTVTFYTFVFAALFLIPISHPAEIVSRMTGYDTLLFLGIALICTLIPYLLYTYGLSGLETGTAAILATIEPLVGSLLGILAYGENAGAAKISGIALILAAICISQVRQKQS
jgi:DME family drug/metabolite transporter